mgnify:FL=1
MKIKSTGPMLNAYPDSMGGSLKDIVKILEKDEFRNVFDGFYILPSLFHSDLDRGFSIIDYELDEDLATEQDLERLKALGIALKLDFVLNHKSVNSMEFKDVLEKGAVSEYKDFFINWNSFWKGYGSLSADGYIVPEQKYIKDMFFRKPGLPILMVDFPDGTRVPYWNTFYQEVKDDPDSPFGKKYLGQMDLNIKSPLVWKDYEETLRKLAFYGAKLVRLDAFAYAPKEPGERNFLNEPGTWDLLEQIQELADQYDLTLLPEIHAGYGEKIYEKLSRKGYMTYDFFLPGLLIYAIENRSGECLVRWAEELQQKQIRTVNMLGCHDGIPVLDLKGFLPDDEIQKLIELLVKRGGYVKNLHGQKNMYYQVNATYYSALGEDERKLLFARAVQMFMPGRPQVWYLDLFAGKNDYDAVKKAGEGGHKEINRTNLHIEDIEQLMNQEVVKEQLRLLRFRNSCEAFGEEAVLTMETEGTKIKFLWTRGKYQAGLVADFNTYEYEII